jgi:hypothetical protein
MTGTSKRASRLAHLAAPLLASLFLTACGGATSTTGPGSTGGGGPTSLPPGPTAEPGATPGGQATAQAGGNACDLLEDAQIESVTGVAILTETPGETMGLWLNGCTWTLESGIAGAPWQVVLGVLTPGGRHYYDTFMAIMEAEPITGLGDVAIRSEANTVVAVKGDALVAIQYIDLSAPREEVPVELIKVVFASLGA